MGFLPYISFFLVLLIFTVTEYFTVKSQHHSLRVESRLHSTLLAIGLILFVGLSFKANYDFTRYEDIYYHVKPIYHLLSNYIHPDPHIYGEPLFIFFASLFKTILAPYNLFLTFFVGASILIRYKVYKKYTKYVILALLIYFCHEYLHKEFTQIRAGLATAILLFTIKPLRERNFLKFLGVIIIASLFHISALIGIFLYFIPTQRFSTTLLFVILLFFILTVPIQWFHQLVRILSDKGIIPAQVALYAQSQQYGAALGILNPITLIRIFVVLFCLRFRTTLSNRIPDFEILFKFYFFSTIIILFFNEISIIGARVSSIFMGVEPIILIGLAELIRPKEVGYVFLIGYALLFTILNIYLKNTLLPYHLVFF